MAGGLLNLVSHGQENVLLFGNPQKTYFKTVYKKTTNFGLQKFRVDFEGSRVLHTNTETKMEFKIPRYADLLYDSYLVINIPDIWSPLYQDASGDWVEYGFKWIDELGSNLIKELEILAGGQILGKYSGEYFANAVHRDYNNTKIDLWNRMTGNVDELNDPANAFTRVNMYPNAFYTGSNNIRPSIRGRKLYIPIDAWFGQLASNAFPLISMQYMSLTFMITFRSIKDLYTLRDVTDKTNNYPYVAPDINNSLFTLRRFLAPPTDTSGNNGNQNDNWNADIHILSNYVFLDTEERQVFSRNNQEYLIKEVYEWDLPNTTGSSVVEFDTRGLVSNYMFRFRRSDANLRNTWSNYTNWPYNYLPYEITNTGSPDPFLFITGNYTSDNFLQNDKNILLDMAIMLDGKYRENTLDGQIYNYVEKYKRTDGAAKDGLYLYSFALNTTNNTYQPSGAMNLDRFDKIQFEINTIEPPRNPSASSAIVDICDVNGDIIGVRKNVWDLNEYNYDLTIFEERYNVLMFQGGMVGLKYAR